MATLTVYSGLDGQVQCDHATYLTARSGSGTLAADESSQVFRVGQELAKSVYKVYESLIRFDTSSLGADVVVTAAALQLHGNSDNSTTEFVHRARVYDFGSNIETSDFVAGASLSSLTLVATFDTTAGISTSDYTGFADVALPANINKTGMTHLIVSSSRTEDATAPSGQEVVAWFSANDAGTIRDPKLVITYEAVTSGLAMMP